MSWFICGTLMPSFPGQLFRIDRVGLKYWVNHSLHWRVRFWSVLTPLTVQSVFSLGYSSVARGWSEEPSHYLSQAAYSLLSSLYLCHSSLSFVMIVLILNAFVTDITQDKRAFFYQEGGSARQGNRAIWTPDGVKGNTTTITKLKGQ